MQRRTSPRRGKGTCLPVQRLARGNFRCLSIPFVCSAFIQEFLSKYFYFKLGYITLQWMNPFDLPNARLQALAPDEIDQGESDSRGYVIAEIPGLPWDVL